MSQHFARAESLFLYAALPRPSSSLAAILAFLTLMSASPETQCRFRTASTGRQNTLNLYNGSRVNRAPSHLLSFTSLMGLAPSSFIFMGGKWRPRSHSHQDTCRGSPSFSFHLFIIWLHRILVTAHRTFGLCCHCNIFLAASQELFCLRHVDLVPWPGMKPRSPTLEQVLQGSPFILSSALDVTLSRRFSLLIPQTIAPASLAYSVCTSLYITCILLVCFPYYCWCKSSGIVCLRISSGRSWALVNSCQRWARRCSSPLTITPGSNVPPCQWAFCCGLGKDQRTDNRTRSQNSIPEEARGLAFCPGWWIWDFMSRLQLAPTIGANRQALPKGLVFFLLLLLLLFF